ncbi:MAG: alanine racemase [Candidatus Eremiobacteraeota bacterium]|nr:alanine racemase [Candidatus Eremiobacteraeota bacterium]
MLGRIAISREALRANARTLRDFCAPAGAGFVVKANAYGHGIIETALAIEGLTSRFCVYSADEAVTLRDNGITKPILVMGPVPHDALEDVYAANAAVALWDTRRYLRALIDIGRKRHGRFPVHVKVNTGLNRLGLNPGDAADAMEDYLRMPELSIEGIFSHLAAAEELDSPYTLQQLATFESALAPIDGMLASRVRPVRHLAASAAAMLWPQTRLDMVRIGIALYGLWPSAGTRTALDASGIELVPALAFRAPLVGTHELTTGEAVGYGTTFHAPRPMRLGVVPVGYADGVPRLLSNRGSFLVDGKRCAIVGRIAMNTTVIDLTAVPGARPGTTVTLLGSDGEATAGADQWADWAETINYEIVARLPEHIEREYV